MQSTDVDWSDVYTSYEIDYDLEEIGRFLSFLHGHVTNQLQEFDEVSESLSGEYFDNDGEPIPYRIDEAEQIRPFPRILCNHVLSSICTCAEIKMLGFTRHHFMRLMRTAYPLRSERRAACDAKLRSIQAAEEFWSEHKLPYKQSTAWSQFADVKRVRNRMIHANGCLDGDAKSEFLRKLVAARVEAGKPGLRIENGRLIADVSYCEEASLIVRQLLIEVSAGLS